MTLKDIEIQAAYETKQDDPLIDFYVPALSEAIDYKRITGFFSSGSLALAARGISKMIERGGHMRILCCPRLSENDSEAMRKAISKPEEYLADTLMDDIAYFEDELERDHVAALGWMLAKGLLEIKIVLVDEPDISVEQLFHQKVGIITDDEGNTVTFSGSVNETAGGWLANIEEFKVFRSWREADHEWMDPDIAKFEDYWNNEREYAEVIELPTAVKERLIEVGSEFRAETISVKRYLEARKTTRTAEDELSLFPYQAKALQRWKENGNRLLFEMATGTGKTRTAIACIKALKEETEALLVIVATPQVTLSQQWADSIDDLSIKFDKTIYADGNHGKWCDELHETILDLRIGLIDNAIVYTTHITAASPKFIMETCAANKPIKRIFVGDETHALGAKKLRQAMQDAYEYRIGLSATPSRWFDDAGSELIKSYYGDKSFEFTIHDALHTINPLTGKTFLTPYEYYPITVQLDSEEIAEYEALTKQISQLYAMKRNGSERFDEDAYQRKLDARASILKNAAGKIPALMKILRMKQVANTIIFVSPQQREEVTRQLGQAGIIAHEFTEQESTKPSDRYKGLSERQYIIKCFAQQDFQALVAINCLNEGIDIPTANTAYLLANSTNPREYVQRVGRVIRRSPGKERAYVYDFVALPDFGSIEESDKELERKILEKELIRIDAMAKNAYNRGDVAGVVTRIWEEFYGKA